MHTTSARLLALAVLAAAGAHAALPPVTPGERVVFSDDFTDNRHEWSSVAVVNTTGQPAAAQAAILKSEWAASVPDSGSVASSATLTTAPNLADGPISIYVSAKVADYEGTEGNRFSIGLLEAAPSNIHVRLLIRPATNGFIDFRNEGGAGQSVSLESTRAYFKPDSEPRIFKVTVTASSAGAGLATAEVFRYDLASKAYVSIGVADRLVSFKSGEFQSVALFSRNAENGAAWIDSVVVTQRGGTTRR